jgi:hypothetical protein
MQEVSVEMDRLAPVLIEAARFVVAGDKGQISSLRLLADEWTTAVSTCLCFSFSVCFFCFISFCFSDTVTLC